MASDIWIDLALSSLGFANHFAYVYTTFDMKPCSWHAPWHSCLAGGSQTACLGKPGDETKAVGLPPVGMFSKITWGQCLRMAAFLWEVWSSAVVGHRGVLQAVLGEVVSSDSNQDHPGVQSTWNTHIQPCADVKFWTLRCWNCATSFLFLFIGYSDISGDTPKSNPRLNEARFYPCCRVLSLLHISGVHCATSTTSSSLSS